MKSFNVKCDNCKNEYKTDIFPNDKIQELIFRVCPECKTTNLLIFDKASWLEVFSDALLLAEYYDTDPIALEFTQVEDSGLVASLGCKMREANEKSILEANLPIGFVLQQIRHLLRYKFVSSFCYNKEVLDIGCGCGYGSYIISRNAKFVIGMDTDKNAIEFAKKHYENLFLKFIEGNIESRSYDTDALDIITAIEVFEHIRHNDINNFIQKLKRFIKQDGLVIISTPRVEETIYYNIDNPHDHSAEYSKKDFIKILEENGLRIEQYVLQKYNGDIVYNVPKNTRFEATNQAPLTSWVQIAICRIR